MVVVSSLTVLIVNSRGHVDLLLIFQIRNDVEGEFLADEDFRTLPIPVQERLIEEEVQRRIEGRGLNQPFLIKLFIQTFQALTFSLGEAAMFTSPQGSVHTLDIVLEALPWTLLLFVPAALAGALPGIWVGLRLAKRARWRINRESPRLSLSPVAPIWFLAIFLVWALAYHLRLFPVHGAVSVPPPTDPLVYAWDVARHLALPLLTIAITSLGFWVYSTRNLVLKTMHEESVRQGKTKDPPDPGALYKDARRAAYPRVIAYSAFSLIALWQGAILTEWVFGWPGLGLRLVAATMIGDLPVLIAVTITYAMLFALTIFFLEVLRGLLDRKIRGAERFRPSRSRSEA
ncbi:MAG: ABC transporter permease [Candidatus Thermoplasmatota archaeon]|nr:ABC transporter permease [Candidatus Thermoplasmatota archaeon]